MRKVVMVFSQLLFIKSAIEEFSDLSEQSNSMMNARVNWLIHKNSKNIYEKYLEFFNWKETILKKYAEVDDKGKLKFINEETDSPTVLFFDDKSKDAYEKEVDDYCAKEIEIIFHYDKNIDKKLGDINGPQKLMNCLCRLLDIFENYNKKQND